MRNITTIHYSQMLQPIKKMKIAINILLAVVLFTSCSSGIKEEIIGTWIGSYGTKIIEYSEGDLVEIESMPIDSNFIERPVDTTHFILPRVLEFETDSLVFLYFIRLKSERERFLEVHKMRGTNHSTHIYPYKIKTGKGIDVSAKPYKGKLRK